MSTIHHTGLTVADLDRALAFWRDGLGMRERMSQRKRGGYLEAIVAEPGADVRMVHLGFPDDGPAIELFEYVAPAGGRAELRPADVGFAHVCVLTPAIDPVLERLLAAGGRLVGELAEIDTGANAGGRAVYVRDPDGHVVELFERPEARQ
jgi:catechol 2,3-dioxygenase-like lactoylglutathione lyase family enzyme